MASSSASILSTLTLFSLLFFFPSSSSSSPPGHLNPTITLPLTPLFPHNTRPSSDPWQLLSQLTTASLTRAHHLKHRQNSSSVVDNIPLSARSYGGYSVSLSFGTPAQSLPFVMDTGSSLVWFPCTSRYVCQKCDFSNVDPAKIPIFIPKLSSTARILGCLNPKCGLVFDPDVRTRCPDCDGRNSGNCTRACPTYALQYGSGATVGLLLLESLVFPQRIEPDFLVGCSLLSSRQPSGIAGFGRGESSLPKQMGLKKFSYCLLSHRYDDSPQSSKMTLYIDSDSSEGKAAGVSYTPFRQNPASSNPAFKEYYYVTLRHIVVGDKRVKIPYKFLVPGSDGNGGTIVDSGSTFTFMEKPIFEAVTAAIEAEMANYTRATATEARAGLKPCFNLTGVDSIPFPRLVFEFKGGAEMELPFANYFSLVGDLSVTCLTMVTNEAAAAAGPSIILGNYQSQNFYTEYDLENQSIQVEVDVDPSNTDYSLHYNL